MTVNKSDGEPSGKINAIENNDNDTEKKDNPKNNKNNLGPKINYCI